MIRRRKYEANPGLIETSLKSRRSQVDVNSEILQHVGSADAPADRPIAMLCDGNAGGGGDDSGTGRDVEGAGSVTAGSRSIEHVTASQFQLARPLAHGTGAARKLRRRFAFHLEGNQKTGYQRIGHHIVEN